MAHIQQGNRIMAGSASMSATAAPSLYTPTVIVTNQTELNTELAKSAAALQGQVIGVQYNATPYVITRSGTPNLRRKDFGTGLVICGYGATMPIFSQIIIDDSQGITLHELEIYNTAAAPMIQLYDDCWRLTVSNCRLHGTYYDPNGDYTVTGSYFNGTAFASSTAVGTYVKDFTLIDCEIYDAKRGLPGMSAQGVLRVEGNLIYRTYEDPIAFAAGVADLIVCNWNVMHSPVGKSTDEVNPHYDFIQFLDPTGNVINVEVIGNIGVIGNARGNFQGIFCNFNSTGSYVTGAIKGNLIANVSSHGITIDRAQNLTVIGNTCVSGDVDGGGLASLIAIGGDTSDGVHTVKNNVAHGISVAGAQTNVNNNHVVARSTAALAAIFNGASFARTDITDKATALVAYAMKIGGALDQAVNIGAVGSGYVDYAARTLNTGME
jgi:hypothetical protein